MTNGLIHIIVLYGGRCTEDEDAYVTNTFVNTLEELSKQKFSGYQLKVTPWNKSVVSVPREDAKHTFVIIHRDYLGVRGAYDWDKAKQDLGCMPTIPPVEDCTRIFSKKPYMKLLCHAKIPIMPTLFISLHSSGARGKKFWVEDLDCKSGHEIDSEGLKALVKSELDFDTGNDKRLVLKLPFRSYGASMQYVNKDDDLTSKLAKQLQSPTAPFVLCQAFKLFDELRVFIAGGEVNRAILTLHAENEKRLTTKVDGIYEVIAVAELPEKVLALALSTVQTLVVAGICLPQTRVDIGCVDAKYSFFNGDLKVHNLGQTFFVNEVMSCTQHAPLPFDNWLHCR